MEHKKERRLLIYCIPLTKNNFSIYWFKECDLPFLSSQFVEAFFVSLSGLVCFLLLCPNSVKSVCNNGKIFSSFMNKANCKFKYTPLLKADAKMSVTLLSCSKTTHQMASNRKQNKTELLWSERT
ncbi:hypothetical protein Anas_11037 [Armadillidium nasatum]|uniref:Uncharacterized protein n=1 Tax=Armadillidium nasatum TaxID=96803 RepID=A0A5N5TD84_9CRUS|nr:hypothetical protein Anas_11037 [Armadillidium nasatum]